MQNRKILPLGRQVLIHLGLAFWHIISLDGLEIAAADGLEIAAATSLIEVTTDYAAHFYYMYVEGHTGKHLTGDWI